MGRNCCVQGCKNSWQKNSLVSFFRFPMKNETLFKQWKQVIPTNRLITKYTCICSDHFDDTSFSIVSETSRTRHLKNNAIPNIFNLRSFHDIKFVKRKLNVSKSVESNNSQGVFQSSSNTFVCENSVKPLFSPINRESNFELSYTVNNELSSLASNNLELSYDTVTKNDKLPIIKEILIIPPKSLKTPLNQHTEPLTMKKKESSTLKQMPQLGNVIYIENQGLSSVKKVMKDVATDITPHYVGPSKTEVELRRKIRNLQKKLLRRERQMNNGPHPEGLKLELLQNESKKHHSKFQKRYSSKLLEFASTLYFYSPKAYNFARTVLNLPHEATIRKKLCRNERKNPNSLLGFNAICGETMELSDTVGVIELNNSDKTIDFENAVERTDLESNADMGELTNTEALTELEITEEAIPVISAEETVE